MIRVTLFHGNGYGETEAGHVELATLLVNIEGDYHTEPHGILTLEEVKQLCERLRHLPQDNSGVIGKFHWRVDDS